MLGCANSWQDDNCFTLLKRISNIYTFLFVVPSSLLLLQDRIIAVMKNFRCFTKLLCATLHLPFRLLCGIVVSALAFTSIFKNHIDRIDMDLRGLRSNTSSRDSERNRIGSAAIILPLIKIKKNHIFEKRIVLNQ